MNSQNIQKLPDIVVAAAIIFHEGSILLTRRMLDADQGGLWEFPGGKREVGETLEQCLRRELKEEIDIHVGNVQPFYTLRHQYPDKEIELHFFTCSIDKGNPKPLGCIELAWVPQDQLASFNFPAADQAVLKKILQGFPEKAFNVKA